MNVIKGLATAGALALATQAGAQGVTDTEVKLGGAHDLSGIFAPFSVPATQAANAYFDAINAAGGVHGRKITYIIEDHGYQVPRAAQAANKLINRDEVFAFVMNLGTPTNLAMFQQMAPQGIPNVSPLTGARQMVEPFEPWKFAGVSTYYDASLASMRYMAENEGTKKVCLMILPTDFGNEIKASAQDLAAEGVFELGVEIGHKPDETDFTGALGRVRDDGCDTVGLALGVGQIINAVATANKLGMTDTKFYVATAGFHTVVAKALAKQGVTSGLYAGGGWQDLEARLSDPAVSEWVAQFKAATGEDFPSSGAILGRQAAELVVRALEAAGPDLTRESFVAALESLDYFDPIGGAQIKMGPEDHTASDEIFLHKINNGSWELVKTLE
ncbi:ABC transporter substrate-binding protein [Tropicibacter naphthalenivorans]|uniref:Leucine ABC transporter subunit substrate-binding protein LivK n=1 Tax=Tropicibacter naphthalenivorans TaxID=441103 RepID=A0A0P1GHJ7_9RHOB|nr:ABC transporter substrate-binding protein [Tropicibacter naphthalenivorans]CUH81188.1 leucine ABC transporter subunit substrate-binding protein LivK [Tropicibacter naphthalenivorans]SMC97600.1 amino acid/amide ABC transporter substrate-binding protein, HAAT family [Tropicibacter naphthalenivorans]